MQQLFKTIAYLHLFNSYVLIIVKGWNFKNVFVTEAQPLNWAGLYKKYKYVYCIQEILEITCLSCFKYEDGLWENCDTWSVMYLNPHMSGFMKNDKTKLFFSHTLIYLHTGTEAEKQDKV